MGYRNHLIEATTISKIARQQHWLILMIIFLLPDKTFILFLSTNSVNIFRPKYRQTVVAEMKFRMNLCFAVARNEVPVDIVFEIHDALVSETARYNACIWCHYIGWDLNICIGNLDKYEFASTWGGCYRNAK